MAPRPTASPAATTLVESDTTIALAGRPPLAARIYGSRRPGVAAPLVLHFHGGAFVSGDLDSGACMARLMADVGAVVVSLAYPLAPENPFPQAVEAGHAALDWLYKQRNKLGGKGAQIYVAGDEAGANLAAAAALMARDQAHPPLAGQLLIAPMLDPCVGTSSQRQTMGCGTTSCKWADGWQQYLRSPMDAEHPYAVPARAQRLVGLPPTLILTGADDPMRDEALAYGQRLRDAGIPVMSELLPLDTGWPDSLLADPARTECPCAAGVQRHFRAFFNAAAPPPT